MKKLYFILLLILPLFIDSAKANNVKIENIIFDQSNLEVTFDLSWENSWKFGDYHDAVWIFVKYNPNNVGSWLHAKIDSTGCSSSAYELEFAEDNMGIYVKRLSQGQGNNNAGSVTLKLNGPLQGIFPDIKVYGIEMVNVPQGAFYFGDPASIGSLVHFNTNLNRSFPIYVESSRMFNLFTNNNIKVIDNNLFPANYSINTAYPDFPTGYNRYYCMKYELTQRQYVDFLNSLNRNQQILVAKMTERHPAFFNINEVKKYINSVSDTPVGNSSICVNLSEIDQNSDFVFYHDLDNDGVYNEDEDGADYAAPIDPIDLMAYLKWAALRPMTEFEYEKACRGPVNVVPGEFAWGSPSFKLIDSYNKNLFSNFGKSNSKYVSDIAKGPLSIGAIRNGMFADTSKSRLLSGGSFYGIMDLSNSLAELVISYRILNPSFTEDNGNGLFEVYDNFKFEIFFVEYFALKNYLLGANNYSEGSVSGMSWSLVLNPEFLAVNDGWSGLTYYNKTIGGRGVRTHNK